jgi:arabinofuranan 3-O-arabinosyltransferase
MDATAVVSLVVSPRIAARRLIRVIGLALAFGYLIVLLGTYLQGQFLTDVQGRPIANDFVDVYAAGRLALDGAGVSSYDWPVHRAAEIRALGHDFSGYYGWPYPPTFLFVAAALALLPYLGAMLVWLAATLAAYAATMRYLVGDRIGILVALGFPAAIWNVTAGQNGFLTATLIGCTLAFLEERPALAGVFLGLLTYKPQFGLLFPLVLIADRRWLTLTVAALVALVWAAAAWLAFGDAGWLAFFHSLPATGRVVLSQGGGDWNRLQSLFGFMRAHGTDDALAWTVQIAGSLTLAAWLVWLWRSRAAFELKAAAMAAGTLIATPYVYMYDMVVLAVAVGFLLQFALDRGMMASEMCGLACAGALILAFPYLKSQTGLAAAIIVLILVAQRAISVPRPRAEAAAS